MTTDLTPASVMNASTSSAIIADVGLVLRKPASKVGRLGVLARQNADRELGRHCIVRAIERDRCERPAPESSLGPLAQSLACALDQRCHPLL